MKQSGAIRADDMDHRAEGAGRSVCHIFASARRGACPSEGAQNSEEHGVTVVRVLNELCVDKQHYTVIVAPAHRGFIHPLAR